MWMSLNHTLQELVHREGVEWESLLFLAINSCAGRAEWVGELSWWGNQAFGLQSALVEHISSVQHYEFKEKRMSLLVTHEWICLASFEYGDGGLLRWDDCWFMAHTYKLTFQYCASFRHPLKALAHVDKIILLLTNQVGHKFSGNPLPLQVVQAECSELSQTKLSVWKGLNFFCKQVLSLDLLVHIYICFACWWTLWAFNILSWSYTTFKLGETTK